MRTVTQLTRSPPLVQHILSPIIYSHYMQWTHNIGDNFCIETSLLEWHHCCHRRHYRPKQLCVSAETKRKEQEREKTNAKHFCFSWQDDNGFFNFISRKNKSHMLSLLHSETVFTFFNFISRQLEQNIKMITFASLMPNIAFFNFISW